MQSLAAVERSSCRHIDPVGIYCVSLHIPVLLCVFRERVPSPNSSTAALRNFCVARDTRRGARFGKPEHMQEPSGHVGQWNHARVIIIIIPYS